MTTLERHRQINLLNILAMSLAALVSCYLPFELLLFSYGVLGPLHYLTEISWLYERKFFTRQRFDWAWFLIPAIAGSALHYVGDARIALASKSLFLSSIVLAIVCVATSRVWARAGALLVGAVLGLAMAYSDAEPLLLAFTALLPTLVHVYIFTGLFMTLGVKRAPTALGITSTVVYWTMPWVLLHIAQTPASYAPSYEVIDAAYSFAFLLNYIHRFLGLTIDSEGVIAFGRLLAFAYTYHYLNWFTKTEIIKWHQMPRVRAVWIAVIYLISVTLYVIDFRLGFGVLLALSLAHVMLELPLNVQSVCELLRGGRCVG